MWKMGENKLDRIVYIYYSFMNKKMLLRNYFRNCLSMDTARSKGESVQCTPTPCIAYANAIL